MELELTATDGPIPATVWTVIEANSGIITACLPTLRQPFVRVFGRAAQVTRRQSTISGATIDKNRLSRLTFDKEHVSSSQTNTVVASQHDRESHEHILGRDSNIFVSRDIRITSTAAQSDRSGAKAESGTIEMT